MVHGVDSVERLLRSWVLSRSFYARLIFGCIEYQRIQYIEKVLRLFGWILRRSATGSGWVVLWDILTEAWLLITPAQGVVDCRFRATPIWQKTGSVAIRESLAPSTCPVTHTKWISTTPPTPNTHTWKTVISHQCCNSVWWGSESELPKTNLKWRFFLKQDDCCQWLSYSQK